MCNIVIDYNIVHFFHALQRWIEKAATEFPAKNKQVRNSRKWMKACNFGHFLIKKQKNTPLKRDVSQKFWKKTEISCKTRKSHYKKWKKTVHREIKLPISKQSKAFCHVASVSSSNVTCLHCASASAVCGSIEESQRFPLKGTGAI